MIIVLIHQLLASSTHGKISKLPYKNNKFKISATTWNDKSGLLDGSYSVSDIPDNSEYIIKKHETVTRNPPVQNIYYQNWRHGYIQNQYRILSRTFSYWKWKH